MEHTSGPNHPRARIDVGGVLHTGRELHVAHTLDLPSDGTVRFPELASVTLDIRRAGRGLSLQGRIGVTAEADCARCLDSVRFPLELDVDETFDPAAAGTDPLSESNVLSGDDLDVRDLVRQLVDSALPYVVLCREDCPGLCAECGLKNDGACRCHHPE